MDKGLILLIVLLVGYIAFRYGHIKGQNDTADIFRNQLQSHKTFYEHNLKAECSKRKFYKVVGE